MTQGRKKRRRRNLLVKSKKTLSMEEKSPTMPSVVFLKYLKITGWGFDSQGKFEYATLEERDAPTCPHCGAFALYAHGYYHRWLSLKGRDGARKRIRLKEKRYLCRCCRKSFFQSTDHIGVAKYQRRNARLNDAISRECANGVSNKNIGEKYRISTATVERQLHKNHAALLREQLNYPCPQVLGIDEHSIHRGRTKGHKFAVTLADLRHHRIYEVFEGKDSKNLEANLRRLKGREKVKVVCMDLCSSFRSMVMRLFPYAKIVADRFHVIRLVMATFHEFCKAEDPDIRWKRGITGALRTKGSNLTAKQKELLQKEFAQHPAIQTAHEFKEELCSLLCMNQQKKINCVPLLKRLKEMVWMLIHDAPEVFKKLGRTLRLWFEPIIRMWRFTKSNGITEGFHRKMKLIQRRAYGYRNFQNYRLRVLIECGHMVI
ncbi:MAG: ISL3 family transposase [Akkermansia sp.]|nr:ISL3 family transposase [Akkermansia sp.]